MERSGEIARLRAALYRDQRRRISRLLPLGTAAVVAYVVVGLEFHTGALILGGIAATQIIAGLLAPTMRQPYAAWFATWWVFGMNVLAAAAPLVMFTAADDQSVAWVLTVLAFMTFGDNGLFVPQTFSLRLAAMSLAVALPYAAVFTIYGHWLQLSAVLLALLHFLWGSRGIVALVRDLVDQRIEADLDAEEAGAAVLVDSLTGLANREGLAAAVEELLADWDHHSVQSVLVDIDEFKRLNESYGYEVGDQVLIEFGQLLDDTSPPGWTVGRLGGDEFAAVGANADLEALADRLRRLRVSPRRESGQAIEPVGASVGAAELPPDEVTPYLLLVAASDALFEARRRGRYQYFMSSPEFRSKQVFRRELAEDLERGLGAGEFVPYGQPLVDTMTGETVGIELLARWQRGSEMVFPDDFIPLLEQARHVHWLDLIMLRHGVSTLQRLSGPGLSHIDVAVNLSATHMREPSLVTELDALFVGSAVDASRLHIEITESEQLKAGTGAIRVAERLRELGVGLSIDDFGTGYSSMTQLLSFPFTEMKLDRSLVSRIAEPEANDLLRSLTDFGMRHGLTIVAEGIETEEQLALVQEAGVPVSQGYLFSKPMPIDELLEAIEAEDLGTRGAGLDIAA